MLVRASQVVLLFLLPLFSLLASHPLPQGLKPLRKILNPKKMAVSEKRHYNFAYYVTGHGYGHATRVVEVCRSLLASGHQVTVCTCAPPYIFTRVCSFK